MFMQDNDRQTDLLAEKVAALKGVRKGGGRVVGRREGKETGRGHMT